MFPIVDDEGNMVAPAVKHKPNIIVNFYHRLKSSSYRRVAGIPSILK
jgi:hypothetical protein